MSFTNTNGYFTNGKVIESAQGSTTFPGTGSPVKTFTYNSGFISYNRTITAGQSYTYWIVGDLVPTFGTLPATVTVAFSNTNSTPNFTPASSITNSVPMVNTSLYFAWNSTGVTTQTTLVLNNASNLVLYGVTITTNGTTTVTSPYLNFTTGSNTNPNGNLTYQLYLSTSGSFATATQVSGATFSQSTNNLRVFIGSTATFNTGTSYTYYLVENTFTGSSNLPLPLPLTFTGFDSNGGPYNYNTTTASGLPTVAYNLVSLAYDWTGATDNNFATATNYTLAGTATVASSSPISSTAVNIGVNKTYTNLPNVGANTTIAALSINNAFGPSPSLTISSGFTLTSTYGVNITSTTANPATINGPGTLSLPANSTNTFAAASVFNLAGAANLSNAGNFILSSTSVLNITGSSTLANTGTFTLNSDASGSATIGSLVSGNITGTYQVQRFVTGGSASLYRGYRNMSSAISSTGTTGGLIDLSYIPAGTFVTGAVVGTSCTLCTVGGTSSLFLYREDVPVINTSFVSGNFVGVTDINGTALKTTSGAPPVAGTATLPAGNGFYLFFRGDRINYVVNKTTTPFAAADNVTFTTSGTLNKGQIIVKDWFNQGSSFLSFTTATGATAQGFNLVGNPYPSSIDWHKAFSGTMTSGIYAPNTDQTVYIYNTTTKNYSTYQNTSASTGTASGSPGGSNIIPSGQGFFVHAINTSAQLIFNEDAKISSQPAMLLLNAALPGSVYLDQHLRLRLVKDSVNIDESVIVFNDNASTKYLPIEDALYLKGSGVVSLSNMSSDQIALAINHLPLPKLAPTIVPLNVSVTSNGPYSLNLSEAVNIPALFDVWLMDAFSKDSVDIKHNPTYNFNISADTASSSAKRFKLVIRQNTANAYHLLSFNGSKATGGSQLVWTTENEENYTGFTLERSANGSTFIALDVEQATGGGSYSYLDQNPVAGLDLYRLKQVDVNGTITYSNVVQLQYSNLSNAPLANGNINIFPNPVKDAINLNIVTANSAPATYNISITNSSGYIIKTFTSQQTVWQNNIADLTPGMYVIKVINNTDNSVVGTNKFIKL